MGPFAAAIHSPFRPRTLAYHVFQPLTRPLPCRVLPRPAPRAHAARRIAPHASDPMAHAVVRSTTDNDAYFVAGDEWRVGDK